MAWNEPGGNRDDDPWGPRKKKEGPPDLDEVLKNLKKKIAGWFGGGNKGGSGRSGGGGSNNGESASIGSTGIIIILVIITLIWAGTGFYSIDSKERGLVQRFGVPAKTIVGPGLHWHLPYPIEKVTIVNVRNRRLNIIATMLTKDEKLVKINVNVNYRVRVNTPKQDKAGVSPGLKDYLFEVRSLDAAKGPEHTLREALYSALRKVISGLKLEEVLGQQKVAAHISKSQLNQCNIQYDDDPLVREAKQQVLAKKNGKPIVAAKPVVAAKSSISTIKIFKIDGRVERELLEIIEQYKTGFEITNINVQKPEFPHDDVKTAFENVIRAQEEATRLVEKAWGYCQQEVNTANGDADAILKNAEAYMSKKVLDAKGKTSRFRQILIEYEKAPDITRKRLFIETMERVMAKSNMVFIRTKSSGNVLLLPLNQYLKTQVNTVPGK